MSFGIIRLTQGLITVVDEEDVELLNDYNWFVSRPSVGCWYAKTNIKGKTVCLHRLLMKPPRGMQVDHINGCTVDNRKSNLRICTHKENSRNAIIRKDNKTGFKGVVFLKGRTKPYHAKIQSPIGKRVSLGYFDTAEEAGIAYANASKHYFGEFSVFNRPV